MCARGGNFMREYWKRPEETADAFRDGWYHTGDAGYLDENGYLYLVDRVKDMIVTGGENVYSVEVENALATHPAVAQVAVIGIPDDRWGEAVHAIVVLKPDVAATDGRPQGPRPRADRRLQAAEVDRVPRRAAAAVGGAQGAQARAAGAVLGGPGAGGPLTAGGRGHLASAASTHASPAGARSPESWIVRKCVALPM